MNTAAYQAYLKYESTGDNDEIKERFQECYLGEWASIALFALNWFSNIETFEDLPEWMKENVEQTDRWRKEAEALLYASCYVVDTENKTMYVFYHS